MCSSVPDDIYVTEDPVDPDNAYYAHYKKDSGDPTKYNRQSVLEFLLGFPSNATLGTTCPATWDAELGEWYIQVLGSGSVPYRGYLGIPGGNMLPDPPV